MSTFRLATLNAHSFHTSSFDRSNISDLVSILEPFNLDLIALQEIQNDQKWEHFSSRLSFQHLVYGESSESYFGNGIASRHPIASSFNVASASDSTEARSLVQCSLDGLDNLIFAVTHLDHIDEKDRLRQIREFDPKKQNVDILMGDMNALTREDYSDQYYQEKVVEKRKAAWWEKPCFDLTKLITDEWNYQDAFRSFNPRLRDEQATTSRFGTRIDYIYVHPRVYDRWKLIKCEIIDTKGATDHNGVFAEFELKSE